jgi:hypothetical protein
MNNKTINNISNIVKSKIGTSNEHFVNMMTMNKLSQIATHMRVHIEFYDGTLVPCNFYGLSLAPSGFNKGRINNILQGNVFKEFKKEFGEYFSKKSGENVSMLAEQKSAKEGIDVEEAMDLLVKRWQRLPEHLYDFSDATEAGLKGAREKYTMASIGGTCMQIDEVVCLTVLKKKHY